MNTEEYKVMHARGGLQTEYLSPEWMRCVEACLDEAAKLDNCIEHLCERKHIINVVCRHGHVKKHNVLDEHSSRLNKISCKCYKY